MRMKVIINNYDRTIGVNWAKQARKIGTLLKYGQKTREKQD